MDKIRNKRKVNRALFVMECPKCGSICASASEWELLPEWTVCDNCKEDFKLYSEGDKQIIERLSYPRFKAEITFNSPTSDLENIQVLEDCKDPLIMAKAMREAGDYLLNNSKG